MSLETFNDFFSSTAGSITAVILAAIVFIALLTVMKRRNIFSIKAMTYSALCLTFAIVLSNVKLFSMGYGGSVTACSMLFVTIIGYWFGPAIGVMGAITYGLIQFIVDGYAMHPLQLLLDYPVAFGMLGLSGFFSQRNYGLYIGYLAGALGRFFMSFLSGFIFFASYAPEGLHPVLYSLGYNLSYMIPEIIITLVLLSVPAFKTILNREKTLLLSTASSS